MLMKKLRELGLRKVVLLAVKAVAIAALYVLGGPLIRELARGAVGELIMDLRFV